MTAIRDTINAAARRTPKWAVYLAGLIPFAWLVWQLFHGGLGVDPVKQLEHMLGLRALQFLVAGLAVTPLLRNTRVNLVKFRRVLGVLAFFYVSMHLLTWAVLDMGLLWSEIAKDLVKRWYIVIGMAGFVLMLPLAATSNDWAVRRLGGKGWRKLHKAVYAIVPLGALHYVMLVKGFQAQPVVYLAIVCALLAMRLPLRRALAPARA